MNKPELKYTIIHEDDMIANFNILLDTLDGMDPWFRKYSSTGESWKDTKKCFAEYIDFLDSMEKLLGKNDEESSMKLPILTTLTPVYQMEVYSRLMKAAYYLKQDPLRINTVYNLEMFAKNVSPFLHVSYPMDDTCPANIRSRFSNESSVTVYRILKSLGKSLEKNSDDISDEDYSFVANLFMHTLADEKEQIHKLATLDRIPYLSVDLIRKLDKYYPTIKKYRSKDTEIIIDLLDYTYTGMHLGMEEEDSPFHEIALAYFKNLENYKDTFIKGRDHYELYNHFLGFFSKELVLEYKNVASHVRSIKQLIADGEVDDFLPIYAQVAEETYEEIFSSRLKTITDIKQEIVIEDTASLIDSYTPMSQFLQDRKRIIEQVTITQNTPGVKLLNSESLIVVFSKLSEDTCLINCRLKIGDEIVKTFMYGISVDVNKQIMYESIHDPNGTAEDQQFLRNVTSLVWTVQMREQLRMDLQKQPKKNSAIKPEVSRISQDQIYTNPKKKGPEQMRGKKSKYKSNRKGYSMNNLFENRMTLFEEMDKVHRLQIAEDPQVLKILQSDSGYSDKFMEQVLVKIQMWNEKGAGVFKRLTGTDFYSLRKGRNFRILLQENDEGTLGVFGIINRRDLLDKIWGK